MSVDVSVDVGAAGGGVDGWREGQVFGAHTAAGIRRIRRGGVGNLDGGGSFHDLRLHAGVVRGAGDVRYRFGESCDKQFRRD